MVCNDVLVKNVHLNNHALSVIVVPAEQRDNGLVVAMLACLNNGLRRMTLSDKQPQAIKDLGFATINKVFLVYDVPWWQSDTRGFQIIWPLKKTDFFSENEVDCLQHIVVSCWACASLPLLLLLFMEGDVALLITVPVAHSPLSTSPHATITGLGSRA
ncbi:hypothetical protein PR048_017366 [Dryococelus australis]|uniref:Amine oxidase domain-containing protein n=1 Tax=Dryococelus australis TaxID=614101 RepID=A0ABQ9H9B6_9NEOP|nr:hypothetical protein PR048_017366 [Dryococelus australis]